MIRKYLISFVFVLAISDDVFAESVDIDKINNDNSIFSPKTLSSSITNGVVDAVSAFKPYDFKVGLGLDIGSAGLGVSALANVYRNFTPNVAGFTGVDVRYNFLQFAHSKAHLNIETRNKMDILFKLGARFKVNKNISLSPYAILGTGFGSIKQENGEIANIYSVRNMQNVYETILRNDNTRDIVINKYTDGTNKADASSYANGTTLMQNLKNQGVLDIDPNTKMDYEKMSHSYDIDGLKGIAYDDVFAAGGTVVSTRKDGAIETDEFIAIRPADAYSGMSIHRNIVSRDGTDTISYNCNGHKYDNINDALDVLTADMGGTKFVIADIKSQGTGIYEIISNMKSNSSSYTSSVYNEGPGLSLPTDNYLVIKPTDGNVDGTDVIKYKVENEDAYNALKNDIQNAINTYNSTKINDNRDDLSALDSDTTTTNTINEVKETSTEDDASNGKELIDSRSNTTIDSEQKFFFKGGLGFEMTFEDRFFVRLEYKYSKLSATKTSTLTYYNTYNNISGANYYTRTYDQTTTNTTNNTYNINTSVNPFDSGLTDGSELFDGHNVATITTGNCVGNTTTDVTPTLPTDYTKDTGRSTQTTNTTNDTKVVNNSSGTSFDMHEFSIGFGFYFL